MEECCLCFNSNGVLYDIFTRLAWSYYDIEKGMFEDNIIPGNLLIKCCCNIHFLCVGCLRYLANNYDNHPINAQHSHIKCPYPFEDCKSDFGFEYVFDHSIIMKVLSEEEYIVYKRHADMYAFPGFTVTNCPMLSFRSFDFTRSTCNSEILIEREYIKNNEIGEVVLTCNQNALCGKRFCFHCRHELNFFEDICELCKSTHESKSATALNYYFNKDSFTNKDDILYRNGEITADIALTQLLTILKGFDTHIESFICIFCKTPMFKTEKCNAVSHHNIERCNSCGRVGDLIKGLGNRHWSDDGIGGCYRFDTDSYLIERMGFRCVEGICYGHYLGECQNESHISDVEKIQRDRKRAHIYHALKSLLPNVRKEVLKKLNDEGFSSELPLELTFSVIDVFPERYLDYSQEIVYEQLGFGPNIIKELETKKATNIIQYQILVENPSTFVESNLIASEIIHDLIDSSIMSSENPRYNQFLQLIGYERLPHTHQD